MGRRVWARMPGGSMAMVRAAHSGGMAEAAAKWGSDLEEVSGASGEGGGSGRVLSTSAPLGRGPSGAAGRAAGEAWGRGGAVSAAAVPSEPETMG